MLGIKDIAVYLPVGLVNNRSFLDKFEIDENFLSDKIGVNSRTMKLDSEDTSDMAFSALRLLMEKNNLSPEDIDALIVVTQNPDSNLPHVSAIVHGKAELKSNCAAFDISLGCSGYVYGLSVITSFLAANNLRKGVLITCDPYSKVIDQEDKNTALLFGDAATATLVSDDPAFICSNFSFGTQGKLSEALVCRNGRLSMNGREIFNFAATAVPKHINELLSSIPIEKSEIDGFIFHQGSRFIVQTIAKRLGLPEQKVPISIESIGNTVSSSIPIILSTLLNNTNMRKVLLCGFGVGLSWGSCICTQKEI